MIEATFIYFVRQNIGPEGEITVDLCKVRAMITENKIAHYQNPETGKVYTLGSREYAHTPYEAVHMARMQYSIQLTIATTRAEMLRQTLDLINGLEATVQGEA